MDKKIKNAQKRKQIKKYKRHNEYLSNVRAKQEEKARRDRMIEIRRSGRTAVVRPANDNEGSGAVSKPVSFREAFGVK